MNRSLNNCPWQLACMVSQSFILVIQFIASSVDFVFSPFLCRHFVPKHYLTGYCINLQWITTSNCVKERWRRKKRKRNLKNMPTFKWKLFRLKTKVVYCFVWSCNHTDSHYFLKQLLNRYEQKQDDKFLKFILFFSCNGCGTHLRNGHAMVRGVLRSLSLPQ